MMLMVMMTVLMRIKFIHTFQLLKHKTDAQNIKFARNALICLYRNFISPTLVPLADTHQSGDQDVDTHQSVDQDVDTHQSVDQDVDTHQSVHEDVKTYESMYIGGLSSKFVHPLSQSIRSELLASRDSDDDGLLIMGYIGRAYQVMIACCHLSDAILACDDGGISDI